MIGKLDNGEISVLSHPDRGEFVNQTWFLNSHSAITKLRICKGELQTVSGFILMSDGVSDSIYNKRAKTLTKAAQNIISWLDQDTSKTVKADILSNLKSVIGKRTNDDCSIIVSKKVSIDVNKFLELDLEHQRDYFFYYRNDFLREQVQILKAVSLNENIMDMQKSLGITTERLVKHLSIISKSVNHPYQHVEVMKQKIPCKRG